jgi:hypothetical protein
LFLGVFKMMIKIVKKLFRLCLVALCWGVFVPFATSRLYYFYLDKSVPITGTQLATDLACGFVATILMMGGLMALVFLAGTIDVMLCCNECYFILFWIIIIMFVYSCSCVTD